MAVLSELPNELLSLVTHHLDRPSDLLNLSLSSRRLHEFAELDGWKAFLKGRFRLGGLDSDARNTVHGLTTLYRNWDRKAFLARFIEPTIKTTSLNTWELKTWRGPHGQTMGYQPSIDSYENMLGAWEDRREVLAWSAGTHLVLRVKETGSRAAKAWKEEVHWGTFDEFRHWNSWYSYKIPDAFEGRDDIVSLKLLRPHQKNNAHENIVFGTASGHLSLLSANLERQETRKQNYNTDRRGIGSLSISSASDPLIATPLGDSTLALYPLKCDDQSESPLNPLDQVTPVIQGSRNRRLWSCTFVSDNTIAVGLGPSYEPIHVYEITPSGFLIEPLRKFSLESKFWEGERTDWNILHSTSVYPIMPVQSDSGCSGTHHVFLSGGYDGIVRLHDLRSSRGFETLFWDPTNDSPIYSLAMQGIERVVAGTSMHSMLKVFDMRFSGSHSYRAIPFHQPRTSGLDFKDGDWTYNAIVNDTSNDVSQVSGGWNLYLKPRNPPRHHNRRSPRIEDSPIYSLSIPSATSPNLYAGVEGAVQTFTFTSVLDPHSDPLLSQNRQHFPDSGLLDVKSSYNPTDNVLNLGMYEQGNEQGLGMKLMVQDSVSMQLAKNKQRRDNARLKGLDERWKDPSEDGARWRRGEIPRGPVWRGRGGARGGRGRGRGG